MLFANEIGDGKLSAAPTLDGKKSVIPIIITARPQADRSFILGFLDISIPQASPYFLMTRPLFRLALALTFSLLLHLAPFLRDLLATAPQENHRPPLQARLAPPPPTLAPVQPPLELPPANKATPEKHPEPKKQPPKTAGNKSWSQEIRRQFQQQQARGLFYPAEAIARGLEGEVLVLIILDESGQVSAARVEQGSGYPLLDEAALRAVRALHSLPADAPREAMQPVRFRLH